MHVSRITAIVCSKHVEICCFKTILSLLIMLCSAGMGGVHSNNFNQNRPYVNSVFFAEKKSQKSPSSGGWASKVIATGSSNSSNRCRNLI